MLTPWRALYTKRELALRELAALGVAKEPLGSNSWEVTSKPNIGAMPSGIPGAQASCEKSKAGGTAALPPAPRALLLVPK